MKYLGNDYLANCDYKYRKQVYEEIIDKLSLNQVFIDIFEIQNDVIYVSGFITTFFNKRVMFLCLLMIKFLKLRNWNTLKGTGFL